MDKYVKVSEIIKLLNKMAAEKQHDLETTAQSAGILEAMQAILRMPAERVREDTTGYWIKNPENGMYYCGNCNAETTGAEPFCPGCGAEMQEAE